MVAFAHSHHWRSSECPLRPPTSPLPTKNAALGSNGSNGEAGLRYVIARNRRLWADKRVFNRCLQNELHPLSDLIFEAAPVWETGASCFIL